jgi:hypothetical protein
MFMFLVLISINEKDIFNKTKPLHMSASTPGVSANSVHVFKATNVSFFNTIHTSEQLNNIWPLKFVLGWLCMLFSFCGRC